MEFSAFALDVINQKYAHTLQDGTKEQWNGGVSKRVASSVLGAVGASKSLVHEVERAIAERKFMPGGRYLYASGRPFHQVNNCFAGETMVVTRYGTKQIKDLVDKDPILMTSNGNWVKAQVKSFGIQRLMKVTLNRSKSKKEIFATERHIWKVAKSSHLSEGKEKPVGKVSVFTENLSAGDKLWSVFGYGMSRTPMSVAGIQHGIVFGDGTLPEDDFGFNTAKIRLCGEKNRELLKYFDGYPTRPAEGDIEVSGLPRHYKENASLSFDRSYLLGWLAGYFAADGNVPESGSPTISSANEDNLKLVKDVCYLLGIGACSIKYQDRISNLTNEPSRMYSVSLIRSTLTPDFFLISEHKKRFLERKSKQPKSWTVESVESTNRVEEVFCAVVEGTHEFVLEDNILTGNCLLLKAEDSREGWGDIMYKASMALMTGAGIGIVYSALRERGAIIKKTGGQASGPIALAKMVNEAGRYIRQGGDRRSAIWGGLHWNHPDAHNWLTAKNWSEDVKQLKAADFNFPADLDMTNISIILDDDFFSAYHNPKHKHHALAHGVYWAVIRQMLMTGEPGFSVDVGDNAGEHLRNACTELTSRDDSDICNLGSINLARVSSLDEMEHLTRIGTAFLLAGTVYSDTPYEKVKEVRDRNRRLGLGLMGVHEWLLVHGKKYGPDPELQKYLEVYATSGGYAREHANGWSLSVPLKTRAIAPTGTIGIAAETTTGIEPLFCVAYKRRYAKGELNSYQYVVDPTAKKLIDRGIPADQIEDAYTLAQDVERRVAFQAWVQKYVDHGISSTINLPHWGSELNNGSTMQAFGDMLIKYLPELRGITCYPDGARDGQPLTPVKYQTAVKHLGEIFYETQDVCSLRGGGSCGA